MTQTKSEIVICGAGIAGIATAYELAVRRGLANVLLVDERPPLTLTSDKSTEAYRNWWPGPGDAMVRLMNRSIDLLEALAAQSDNVFHLNRRGYVYLMADPQRAAAMQTEAQTIARLGAGPLRVHDGRSLTPYTRSETADGADLLLDPALIQAEFPFVAWDTVALLHVRRCGWLSAQQLGMWLLEQARAHGVALRQARVTAVETEGGRVTAIVLQSDGAVERVATDVFINAAGPLLRPVGRLLGVELPVYNELHGKIAFDDALEIVPRDAPLMIWNDPIRLPWRAAERAELAAVDELAWLLDELPAGLHFRPEGGPGSQTLLALWPYHIEVHDPPTWPVSFAPEFAEVVVRGLARMMPGMGAYLERMPRPWIDGGYYCKTRENRPLVGPLPVAGAYVIGALSGYGIMAAPAAAELLAAHVTGGALPPYAAAFDLRRYDDDAYRQLLDSWDATAGQL